MLESRLVKGGENFEDADARFSIQKIDDNKYRIRYVKEKVDGVPTSGIGINANMTKDQFEFAYSFLPKKIMDAVLVLPKDESLTIYYRNSAK